MEWLIFIGIGYLILKGIFGENWPGCDICKDCYDNGIKFAGQGDSYFQETTISGDGCLKYNLLEVDADTLATNNVYFIKEGNDSYLIQILDWVQYESSPSLTFKWKNWNNITLYYNIKPHIRGVFCLWDDV